MMMVMIAEELIVMILTMTMIIVMKMAMVIGDVQWDMLVMMVHQVTCLGWDLSLLTVWTSTCRAARYPSHSNWEHIFHFRKSKTLSNFVKSTILSIFVKLPQVKQPDDKPEQWVPEVPGHRVHKNGAEHHRLLQPTRCLLWRIPTKPWVWGGS